MTPRELLAAVWIWHFVWMALLTYAIGKAAWNRTGTPFRWPVPGRWLLTFLFLMFTVMIGDIARLVISHDGQIVWSQPLTRITPVFIEPWVFWRQWRQGLTNDEEWNQHELHEVQSTGTD